MKSIILIVASIAIILLVLIGSYLWWNNIVSAPGNSSTEKRILIEKGASAEGIGQKLESGGVVKSAFAFKLYTQINNLTKNIPPGEFLIPTNLSLKDVVQFLIDGPRELWVTIPEGFRREEIADRLVNTLEFKNEVAAKFRAEFLSETKELEGYLFPDTYLFPRDVTAAIVVRRLRKTFDDKTEKELGSLISENKMSIAEVVTLASIIEKEGKTDEDRPVISGILLNRLENDHPLQADATVQYVVGTKQCVGVVNCDWWKPPSREDLKVNSLFNTYIQTGLPPSPIANPGLSSLNAALMPQESNYFYYIHDENGTAHYGVTLEEHNANVAKFLR